MAKITISLRIPPDLLAEVDAHAIDTDKSRTDALLSLCRLGLERITLPKPSPREVLAKAEEKAAHLSAKAPRRKRTWNLNAVQVGPTRPAPGALLDRNTPKKRR